MSMAAPRGLAAATVALALIMLCALAASSARALAPARAMRPARSPAALRNQLISDLRDAGGASSALVVDETTGQTLLSIAPRTPRLPASVEKLYTTTAALLTLGPTATFTTSVLGEGTLAPGGVWKGTLYLRGGGDPTFGDAHFDKEWYGAGATVQQLAAALKQAGITRLDGSIVGDGSYFDSRRGTPATDFQASTELEGQLDGLSYDGGWENSTGDVLQPDPTRWAASAFASVLAQSGIEVPKHVRITTGPTPAGARLLASVSSPPLSKLMELTNSPSDNFFAETLLKDLGAHDGAGTTAEGVAAVKAIIAQRFGLHPQTNDGSGLSRADRTTAADVVTLLEKMQSDPTFTNSLAIAGVRGTLAHEMVGTPAAGNCRGKTGTLSDVANLVGYCTAANGDQLVFAFLMNGLSSSDFGHEQEDLMGSALAGYKPVGQTKTRTTPTTTTPTRTTPVRTRTVTTPAPPPASGGAPL